MRNPIWSSLIHFGQIWSKKIINKTAIFILFVNVTTFYTNIFLFVQPLNYFFWTDGRTEGTNHGITHRHPSSNSSLDRAHMWVLLQLHSRVFILKSEIFEAYLTSVISLDLHDDGQCFVPSHSDLKFKIPLEIVWLN